MFQIPESQNNKFLRSDGAQDCEELKSLKRVSSDPVSAVMDWEETDITQGSPGEEIPPGLSRVSFFLSFFFFSPPFPADDFPSIKKRDFLDAVVKCGSVQP